MSDEKKPARKKPGGRGKFKPEMYVTTYIAAKQGLSIAGIAKLLGVDRKCLRLWREKYPAMQDAIDRGRSHASGINGGWIEHLRRRLTPEQQEQWDALVNLDLSSDPGSIDNWTEQISKPNLKSLFIFSLFMHNFNMSAACRQLGLERARVEQWKKDPQFLALIEEAHQAKKDFFEDGLIALVAARDTTATIFANKTLNRDRGYGEKVQVEHSGQVNHLHAHASVDLDQLDLPLSVRRTILDAHRKYVADKMAEQGEGDGDLLELPE